MLTKIFPIQKLVLLSLLMVLLAACADLEINSPLPAVESPFATGKKGQLAIDGGLQSQAKLVVTDDASARPPNLTSQRGSQTVNAFGGALLSLGERVDIGARLALPGILSFRALWQVLGENRINSKLANWSLGLFTSISAGKQEESGDQDGNFGPGGNPWRAKVQAASLDGGFSVGYQWGEKTSVFAGLSVGTYKGKYSIEQDATGSDPGGSYNDSFNGHAHTISVGAAFGQETVFNLVGSYHESEIGGTKEKYGVSLTGAILVNVGK